MIKQTKHELELLHKDAQADIEHAKLAAIEAVWSQSASLVRTLAEEVIGRCLTGQDEQRLIEQAIEQLRSGKAMV
ncbi:MAG: hypothetical protein QHH07_10680 [Sedimentisphaerales bacterium]|jgi:F0F1-type ATP synthase membrane subunit b/b'|nr:hypothetical protein [Sedimentisphaerales bacterium]